MPVPLKMFRKPPPKELVDDILRSCGLQGMHDLRWFSRGELKLDGISDWLPLLEPYYIPCKARRFLTSSEMDSARLITVLRHICRPWDHDLITQERLYQDSKQTLYQIQPLTTDVSGFCLLVEFV
jgi:hypothetical protein